MFNIEVYINDGVKHHDRISKMDYKLNFYNVCNTNIGVDINQGIF